MPPCLLSLNLTVYTCSSFQNDMQSLTKHLHTLLGIPIYLGPKCVCPFSNGWFGCVLVTIVDASSGD